MKLLPKQEHAVYYLKDNETKELVYGGAAGCGKSALEVLKVIENWQIYPGSRWLLDPLIYIDVSPPPRYLLVISHASSSYLGKATINERQFRL